MAWRARQKREREIKRKTLGSNFRATQDKKERPRLWTDDCLLWACENVQWARPTGSSQYTNQVEKKRETKVKLESKSYLWFSFGDQTGFVFSQGVGLSFFSNKFLFFFAFLIVFKDFDLVGIAQIVTVAASVHVRHFRLLSCTLLSGGLVGLNDRESTTTNGLWLF